LFSRGPLAAAVYLLYPPLWGVSLSDFHPIALAIPSVLFALQFAFDRRTWLLLAACLWTLLCKQETALVVAGIGLWYAVRWREPRGLLLPLGAVLWLVVALRIQAHFAGTAETAYVELYRRYGSSTSEIVRTFLFTPWVPLFSLDRRETLEYLALLLAPLALLPLRRPGVLWIALPPLALNLFSERGAMRQIEHQYTALLTPLLFAAAACAAAATAAGAPRRIAGGAWLACALLAALSLLPSRQQAFLASLASDAETAATRRLLETIPRDASVSATNGLVAHLTHRRHIHVFPNPFWPLATGPGGRALRHQLGKDHPALIRDRITASLAAGGPEYIALGRRIAARSGAFPMDDEEERVLTATLLDCPEYGLVDANAGVWLFRQGADHREGLRLLGGGRNVLDRPAESVAR
jgi:hypothetical protein